MDSSSHIDCVTEPAAESEEDPVAHYLKDANDIIYVTIEALQRQPNSPAHEITKLTSKDNPITIESCEQLSKLILSYPTDTIIELPRTEPLKSLIENSINVPSMNTEPSEFKNRNGFFITNKTIETLTGIPVRLSSNGNRVAIIITRSAEPGSKSSSRIGRALDGGVINGMLRETKVVEWINMDNKTLLFKFRYCGYYKLIVFEIYGHNIVKQTSICCNVEYGAAKINYADYIPKDYFDNLKISTHNKGYAFQSNKVTNVDDTTNSNNVFNSKNTPDTSVINSQEPIKQITANPQKHTTEKFVNNYSGYSNSPQYNEYSKLKDNACKQDLYLNDNEERPKKKVKTTHKEDAHTTTTYNNTTLPRGTVNPKDIFGYERNLYENNS